MQKKDFIQQWIIRCLPQTHDQMMVAIEKANTAWGDLTAQGYGDPKQGKQKESKDWYAALTVYQKEWFDRFWQAFNYKKGKQGAAHSWLKLGELGELQYNHIVAAAKQESRNPIADGTSRKWAEGWLSERRFDDYSEEERNKPTRDYNKLSLQSRLNGLEAMGMGDSPEAHGLRHDLGITAQELLK